MNVLANVASLGPLENIDMAWPPPDSKPQALWAESSEVLYFTNEIKELVSKAILVTMYCLFTAGDNFYSSLYVRFCLIYSLHFPEDMTISYTGDFPGVYSFDKVFVA